MQDGGDFNIATSSLHALSNSMTAGGQTGERQSPHTSPRFSRRSTTPNLMAVQNDLYAAGTIPALSLAGIVSVGSVIVPSAPTINVVNGGGGCSSSATQKSNNRMSAPLIGAVAKQHQQLNLNNNNNNNHSNININCSASENGPLIYGQRATEPGAASVSASAVGTKETSATYAILAALTNTTSAHTSATTSTNNDTNIISSGLSSSSSGCNGVSCNDMQQLQQAQAPPLPPRKSSPGVSECSFQQTLNSNGVMNKIYGCTTVIPNASTINKSDDLDIPTTTVQPVPTASNAITTHNIDLMTEDMRHLGRPTTPCLKPVRSILDEDIEVGPAETIMGVIDTRPLEARQVAPTLIPHNSSHGGNVVSTEINTMDCIAAAPHYAHISATTSQAPTLVVLSSVTDQQCNKSLNIYEQQSKQLQFLQQQRLQQYYQQLQQLQQRQQQQQQLQQQQQQQQQQQVQSPQTQQQQQQPIKIQQPTQSSHQQTQQQQQRQQQNPQQQHLVYENVTINPKDCSNVPYENINLEYITRLMSEGYTKEHAISALVISRNNIEMACDILREFVTKSNA